MIRARIAFSDNMIYRFPENTETRRKNFAQRGHLKKYVAICRKNVYDVSCLEYDKIFHIRRLIMGAGNDTKEGHKEDEALGIPGTPMPQSQEEEADQKILKVKRIKKTLHFMLFGAFLSFLPLLCSIGFRQFTKYDFSMNENRLEYLSDFLLAIFAVASNACGCVAVWNVPQNSYRSITKGVLIFLAVLSMGACIISYAYFFNVPQEFRYDRIKVVFIIAVIVGIANSIVGCVISWHDN